MGDSVGDTGNTSEKKIRVLPTGVEPITFGLLVRNYYFVHCFKFEYFQINFEQLKFPLNQKQLILFRLF